MVMGQAEPRWVAATEQHCSVTAKGDFVTACCVTQSVADLSSVALQATGVLWLCKRGDMQSKAEQGWACVVCGKLRLMPFPLECLMSCQWEQPARVILASSRWLVRLATLHASPCGLTASQDTA